MQSNKAIVGRNAFAHEAGIHQDGILKDRRTYEIMRPEDVGVPSTTLVLGKHSGRHAVQKRCEQLGAALTRFEVDRVYRRMVSFADAHKHVSDARVEGDHRRGRARRAEAAPPGRRAPIAGPARDVASRITARRLRRDRVTEPGRTRMSSIDGQA